MDYYNTLGVTRNSSPEDIKRAYRKQAMANHPDRTGGDDTKFKQVNEAYETLKDPAKKQQYDNPQAQYNSQPFGGPGGFDINDVMNQFGFGGGMGQGARQQMRNRDVNIEYRLTFEELFTGKAVNIQFRLPSGGVETLDAAIPPGVKNNDSVRFAGLGDNTSPHVPRGNLILNIKVQPHPNWTRDNDNIITTKSVSIFDLILGAVVDVSTPNGRHFSLTVPKGTKPGTVFSISGQGVPNVNTRRPGNAHIKVDAVVPKIQDQSILEKLKDIKDEINKRP
jgi:curved DNA-binding protein|tara:strand:- start:1732 stop:2568 length:837 start_codon:yes stop_codon:yes gene_type:complete